MIFKKGDKVVSVDACKLSDSIPEIELELNKIYIVEGVIAGCLTIKAKYTHNNSIRYQSSLWCKEHFISINEFRMQKIKNILNDF
jgi:hypothetical protein